MTEIRACTPEDAIAVSALLGELSYAVSAPQAAERIRRLSETDADPIFLAVSEGANRRPRRLSPLYNAAIQ
jgi:hypothetical protein